MTLYVLCIIIFVLLFFYAVLRCCALMLCARQCLEKRSIWNRVRRRCGGDSVFSPRVPRQQPGVYDWSRVSGVQVPDWQL